MKGWSQTVKIGGIIIIVCTAVLLVALVAGAIDSDQLKSGLAKAILVIGIVVISFIGILSLTSTDKK